VFRAEQRRKARTELRKQLAKIAYFGPDMAEHALSDVIATCISQKEFSKLEEVPVDRYAINHFCDLRFKYRLYEYLFEKMDDARELGIKDIESAIAAIDNWKKQAEIFDTNLKEHFKQTAPMYRTTRYLERFLKRRPLYFRSIVDLFIIDTKEALLTAYSNTR
jgi:hypothetical protein